MSTTVAMSGQMEFRSLISKEIQNAEILDWWEAERFYVWSECNRLNKQLSDLAEEAIGNFSAKDTIWHKSLERDDLKRKITSRIEVHNRRLARHLNASYEKSRGQIEVVAGLEGPSRTEYATIAAGLTTGAGAIGLAVGAAAAIPSASVVLFVIPAGAIGSWPIALTLGASAFAVAWMSPKLASFATDYVRKRYKSVILTEIHNLLLSEGSTDHPSSWQNFSKQLDDALTARLNI